MLTYFSCVRVPTPERKKFGYDTINIVLDEFASSVFGVERLGLLKNIILSILTYFNRIIKY